MSSLVENKFGAFNDVDDIAYYSCVVPCRRSNTFVEAIAISYEIKDWVNDNIGDQSVRWEIDIGTDCGVTADYLFKNKEDAMAFKLRW